MFQAASLSLLLSLSFEHMTRQRNRDVDDDGEFGDDDVIAALCLKL